ncbi:MAG TPA: glycosyltransferase family 4 protein [Candidatus Limnocylindrales bacterium]|nr:glycosyltransferase family 4 protein [Candidatus Limnocylindrales bacterium]
MERSSTIATAATRRVAMLTHSYYEEDPRVRREAETLAAAGLTVEVFALRRPTDPDRETIAGVEVRRLGVQRHQGASVRAYMREYLSFFVRCAVALTRAHARRRFGLVQVHTLPDFLVFATLPLRLTGVPVILDLHEAMPEFFGSRFPGRSRGIGRWLLDVQERLACRYATAIVTVNEALRDRLCEVGVPRHKLSIVPNVPSLARFSPTAYPARPFMADGSLRLVYAGALSPIYELDVVLEAVALVRKRNPGLDVWLDLYGRDFEEVPLREKAIGLGVADRVRLHGRIPVDEVPAAIAAADIGLAPTRKSRFTEYSLSTKAFEYAAMGLPVIASRLPMVVRTFGDDVVTYEPGDANDLAAAIRRVVDEEADRGARVRRALHRVRRVSWEVEGEHYLALVDRLTAQNSAV